MLNELTTAVAQAARLTPEQADLAVQAMLRFLTARLPSALVGELHARLHTRRPAAMAPPDRRPAPPDPESA